LFNSDAEAQPDALAKIVAACETDPTVGSASPLVLEADNHDSIQFGCGLFDLDTSVYRPSYDVEQSQEWQRRFPMRIVLHGTALLIRRSLYDAIGGFDDHFFAYWEDIDYSIRSAKAGFRNVAVLDTAIYHGSKPTREAPETIKPHYYYFVTRNEILMWRKFCSRIRFAKVAVWILQRQLLQIDRMPGYTVGIDAILVGLWHGWRGRGGRYDPALRMPGPLSGIFRRYPRAWIRLLGGGSRGLTT
jgi:GT2 family glycosyltransferase